MTTLYLGDLRTEGAHLKSGNNLITDAPVDNNGKGEAYSPTDLVCAALSSCALTTMGIVANREKFPVNFIAVSGGCVRAVSVGAHIRYDTQHPPSGGIACEPRKRRTAL